MIAPTRLLYLHASGLIALCARRKTLTLEAEFGHEAIDPFTDYARSHNRSTFRLITDLPDESCQPHSLPRTRGADRRHLIERRRAQSFPRSPYAIDIPCAPPASTSKQEHILLLGITRPEPLDPWLDALEAAGARLASLHSLAQAGPILLGKHPARGLLLIPTRSGLRQIFIDHGRLRFSRTTPLNANDTSPLAAWLEEADKTRQYLQRERSLDRASALPVSIASDVVAGSPPDNIDIEYRILSPRTLAKNLGLESPVPDLPAESVLLWALHRHPPAAQLAPGARLKRHRQHRLRIALNAASAALALGFASLVAMTVADTANLRAQENSLPALTAPENLSPQPAPEHQALGRAFDELQQRSPTPLDLLDPLSHALDAHPRIEIDRIEWHNGDLANRTAQAEATLSGHIDPDNPDARNPLDLITAFTQHLQQTHHIDVKLLTLPNPSNTAGTLKSIDTPAPSQHLFSMHLKRAQP